MTSFLLASLLALAPAQPGLNDGELEAIVAKAEAHFKAGEYEVAAEGFATAYTMQPDPKFLYARAQAERLSGDCESAVELYEQFLALELPDELRAPAEQNRRRCQKAEEPQPAPARTPAAGPKPKTAAAPEPPPPSVTEPAPARDQGEGQRWGADPLAAALVGGGAAVAIVGAGLWGNAVALDRRADENRVDELYLDAKNAARTRFIAGATLTGIGGAVLVGGIVRYGVLAARAKKQRSTALQVSPSLQRGQAGIILRGRF